MNEPNGYCTHCNDPCPRCSDVPFDAEDTARERAAVVRYLRTGIRSLLEHHLRGSFDVMLYERNRDALLEAADAIERGDHLKETP